MKNQTYRMTMLFDFYGETLTERQKEFFDLYYNEDLSLGEIAENYGISRQGVRDVIVRAEASMQEIEDKTGLIRRFMQMQPKIAAIEEAAQKIKTLNYRQYENPQLEALAAEIMENSAVFLSPTRSSSSSSYMVISRTSLMSNGASLAPQLIKIDLAVLPETNCQGLFNRIHKNLQKGARSTVWLLTPRLTDYIFPFSRSLQRYA